MTGQPTTKYLSFLTIMVLLLSCNFNKTKDKSYNELEEKDYKRNLDTVDGEAIYSKTAISKNTPQDFADFNKEQKIFIEHSLQEADTLIKLYAPNSDIENLSIKTLDNIIDKWNVDSSRFNCTKTYFVNAIGTAFGHYLVKTYKMKWAIVTDEYGTDYATTIKENNLTDFPLNSVLKAIVQKRSGSLNTISLMTKKDISDFQNKK